jgi:hypothetical protein
MHIDGSIIDSQGITQAMQGLRYDAGTLFGPEKTEEGYLRCWATIARTGIQTYKRADGSEIVEYRPAEEVGKVDSLASFAGKAVTLEHPRELLNTENTSRYQVGFSDSEILFDGNYVRVRLTITDAEAIAAVESGATPEVSAGYQVDLESQPGVTPDGHHYDAVQRSITGNHIALTRKGRAGAAVKVHLDHADAVAVPIDPQLLGHKPMAKITIAGAEFEVSEAVAVAYTTAQRDDAAQHQKKLDTLEQANATITTHSDDLQAKLDAAIGTSDELKARIDGLTADLEQAQAARTDSGDDLEARLDARLALIDKARTILDAEFEFRGKSDREVQEAVIQAAHGDSLELADRADAYVEARFDAVIDLAEHADSSLSLRQSVGAALRQDSGTAKGGEASDSRKRYLSQLEEGWKTPARKSKGDN